MSKYCFHPFLVNLLMNVILSACSQGLVDPSDLFNLKLVKDIDLILCDENHFGDRRNITLNYSEFATVSIIGDRLSEVDMKYWTHSQDRNRIAIMIVATNYSSFVLAVEYVSNIHGNDTFKWKPFWFIVWPEELNNKSEIEACKLRMRPLEVILRKCKINSQVFIVFALKESTTHLYHEEFALLEIYGVKDFTAMENYPIGFNKLGFENITNKANRRHFQGITIRGVSVDDPKIKLVTEFEEVDGELRFKSGLAVEAINFLAQSLNFSIQAIRAKGYMARGPNGTITGMGEQLINQEADIIVSNPEMLDYRMNGLNFLPCFYTAQLTAYFIQPPASEVRNIYLQPFTLRLWITILISWICILTCLALVNYVKEKTNIVEIEDESDKQLVKESILWAIGAISQQGWYINPNSGSSKVVFITGFFTAVLTYSSYAAVIISTLSVVTDPIRSISDLEKSGIIIYADPLIESSQNVVQVIANRKGMKNYPNKSIFMEISEAIPRFSTLKACAVVTVDDLFYYSARNLNYTDQFLCNSISYVKIPGPYVQGGMYIKARSPFREHFKHRFLVFRERAVSKRAKQVYMDKAAPSCFQKQEKTGKNALGLADVISAYALLTAALIISLMTLSVEKLYFWVHMKRISSTTILK